MDYNIELLVPVYCMYVYFCSFVIFAFFSFGNGFNPSWNRQYKVVLKRNNEYILCEVSLLWNVFRENIYIHKKILTCNKKSFPRTKSPSFQYLPYKKKYMLTHYPDCSRYVFCLSFKIKMYTIDTNKLYVFQLEKCDLFLHR